VPPQTLRDIITDKNIDMIFCSINYTIKQLPVDTINKNNVVVICHAHATCCSDEHRMMFDPVYTEHAEQEDIDKLLSINNVVLWAQHELPIQKNFMYGYINNGLKLIHLPHAADIDKYMPPKQKTSGIDIAFVGGIGHKMESAARFLRPLVHKYEKSFYAFGDMAWINLGINTNKLFDTNKIGFLYGNATVCPNIQSDSMRHHKAIVNERSFIIPACGGFIVTDMLPTRDYFDCVVGEIPYSFIKKVQYYIDNPKIREEYIGKSFSSVVYEHSYYNRMIQLFEYLGLDVDGLCEARTKQITKCVERYEEWKSL
jgi:hypothetical protein